MPRKAPTYRPPHLPTRIEQKRQQDERRGSARERGYTRRWDRSAKAFVTEHPLCLGCEAIGRAVPTELVDHIEPHKGDMELFWREDNRQPSCGWHHRVVKAELERLFFIGAIAVDQLRLDSAKAVELTRGGGGGSKLQHAGTGTARGASDATPRNSRNFFLGED